MKVAFYNSTSVNLFSTWIELFSKFCSHLCYLLKSKDHNNFDMLLIKQKSAFGKQTVAYRKL